MKKHRFEIIIFFENIVYMILELVASRVLSPYFGSSNTVWTSVIGIILLSSSLGNYLGGIIADKGNQEKNIKRILAIACSFILVILAIQNVVLNMTATINNIKIGAIISTIILFFLPSMFLGLISPIVIKLSLENIDNAGKISGRLYAVSTLGGIVGTFLGGFWLLPTLGTKSTLFILAMILGILIFIVDAQNEKKNKIMNSIIIILLCLITVLIPIIYKYCNNLISIGIKEGKTGITAEYDSQYGKIEITNYNLGTDIVRSMKIDKGNESTAYISNEKKYELFAEYTRQYDLIFKADKEINNVLMIGGAGYSYPKHFISTYENKNIDVVEIDEKVTELAKKYFGLDYLIDEFDLNNNRRLGLITQDGRVYLNKNTKKYDAILNDAFSGTSPAETLTTVEAIDSIKDSLSDGGVYITNVIGSIEGKNSRFLYAETNTIMKVFEHVYVIPCNSKEDKELIQNNMIIASNKEIKLDNVLNMKINNTEIVLTDDCCPVDNLVPII